MALYFPVEKSKDNINGKMTNPGIVNRAGTCKSTQRLGESAVGATSKTAQSPMAVLNCVDKPFIDDLVHCTSLPGFAKRSDFLHFFGDAVPRGVGELRSNFADATRVKTKDRLSAMTLQCHRSFRRLCFCPCRRLIVNDSPGFVRRNNASNSCFYHVYSLMTFSRRVSYQTASIRSTCIFITDRHCGGNYLRRRVALCICAALQLVFESLCLT
uniref:WGS project CAFE00000000 data, contig n=1 Tax=Steinernema glaseri TaxID=37863 RepID=A0A1I7YBJ2_9BILA